MDGEGRGGNDGTVDWKYLKYSTLRYIIVRYLYTIHLYTLTLIHLYKYSFMNSVIKRIRVASVFELFFVCLLVFIIFRFTELVVN